MGCSPSSVEAPISGGIKSIITFEECYKPRMIDILNKLNTAETSIHTQSKLNIWLSVISEYFCHVSYILSFVSLTGGAIHQYYDSTAADICTQGGASGFYAGRYIFAFYAAIYSSTSVGELLKVYKHSGFVHIFVLFTFSMMASPLLALIDSIMVLYAIRNYFDLKRKRQKQENGLVDEADPLLYTDAETTEF